MYEDLIRIALSEMKTRLIGEGTEGYILNRFTCAEHKDICIKVCHSGSYKRSHEWDVLCGLHSKGLQVPTPIADVPDMNAYVMEKVVGMDLDQVHKYNLRVSKDVLNELAEAMNAVCTYCVHGDLSPRNVMLGDITIEDNVIVDAVPYVIDFGHSRLNKGLAKIRSQEWISAMTIIRQRSG